MFYVDNSYIPFPSLYMERMHIYMFLFLQYLINFFDCHAFLHVLFIVRFYGKFNGHLCIQVIVLP